MFKQFGGSRVFFTNQRMSNPIHHTYVYTYEQFYGQVVLLFVVSYATFFKFYCSFIPLYFASIGFIYGILLLLFWFYIIFFFVQILKCVHRQLWTDFLNNFMLQKFTLWYFKNSVWYFIVFCIWSALPSFEHLINVCDIGM